MVEPIGCWDQASDADVVVGAASARHAAAQF
jgi:hypothetical protein